MYRPKPGGCYFSVMTEDLILHLHLRVAMGQQTQVLLVLQDGGFGDVALIKTVLADTAATNHVSKKCAYEPWTKAGCARVATPPYNHRPG